MDLDDKTLVALRAEPDRRGVPIDGGIAESVCEHLDASPPAELRRQRRFGSD